MYIYIHVYICMQSLTTVLFSNFLNRTESVAKDS